MDKSTLKNLRFAAFDILWLGFAFGLGGSNALAEPERSRNVVYGSESIALSLLQVVFVLVLFTFLLILKPRWKGGDR
jgi:hypothetical protein